MLAAVKNFYSSRKERVLFECRSRIREKAIRQAKARIALAGRKVEDFDSDELEIIVQDEEVKVTDKLKHSCILGLLILIGLG